MTSQSKLFFEVLLLALELLSWTAVSSPESLRQIYRRGAMNDALQEEKWEGQVPLGMTSHIPINQRPFSDHSLHDWMIVTHRWCTSQHHSIVSICWLSVTLGCVGSLREWVIFEQALLGKNRCFSVNLLTKPAVKIYTMYKNSHFTLCTKYRMYRKL